MAKRKLKKKVKIYIILFILLVICILGGISAYKTYKYHKTYEYKLLQINYPIEDINIIVDKLDNEKIDRLLTQNYDKNIAKILTQKYYLQKNYDRYMNYLKENNKTSIEDVVTLVNVNRDRDYYEDITNSDISKETSILVNKYHKLEEDFDKDSLTKVSSSYAYGNNYLNKEAYEAFKNLAEDAKEEGHTILIISGYRSYEEQEELWEERKKSSGTKKADSYAARAGSSEHETGLAIDVGDYYDENDDFGKTESFKWMIENAHKYGFILRYPEGKENITGYSYEPWHYRYLGIDLATKVYNEKITYDEYYEYYLN